MIFKFASNVHLFITIRGGRMAGKKKAKTEPRKIQKKRHWKRWILLAALLCAAIFFLWMHLNAVVVHVRYADVYLEDLPEAFEGVTILFASDIDLCGLNTASQAGKLFDELQSLSPDILLLGGDYASNNLIEYLNGGADKQSVRSSFFKQLSDFEAPLGKFAVSGDNDGDTATLRLTAVSGGVQVIDGSIASIEIDDSVLYLAGIGSETEDISLLASQFSSGDCVILLTHTPDVLTSARIVEASDGGSWADLTLCGHTHAGQIQIFGRTLLSLTETEDRYLNGWYTDSDYTLVTSGVGCEYANLRLGTQAEVWMITLHCKESEEE